MFTYLFVGLCYLNLLICYLLLVFVGCVLSCVLIILLSIVYSQLYIEPIYSLHVLTTDIYCIITHFYYRIEIKYFNFFVIMIMTRDELKHVDL